MTNQENDRILRQWYASETVREYLYEILENIDIVSSGQVKVFLVGLIEKTGFRNVKNAIEDIEIQLNFDLSGKCSTQFKNFLKNGFKKKLTVFKIEYH